jgi:hypothetical protein
MDTVGVGTRRDIPFNFPLSSGITTPTTLAAPVLVGTYSGPPREPGAGLYAAIQKTLIVS